MFSVKTLVVIQEQFGKLNAECHAIARWPELMFVPSYPRDEALLLCEEAFRQLAGGDALPFFRPHLLDVSAGLFDLTRRLTMALGVLSSMPLDARQELSDLPAVFKALSQVLELFRGVWLSLSKDKRASAKMLEDSTAMISKFEDVSMKHRSAVTPLMGPLTDSLYALDFSLKRLVVLLQI